MARTCRRPSRRCRTPSGARNWTTHSQAIGAGGVRGGGGGSGSRAGEVACLLPDGFVWGVGLEGRVS